MCGIALNNESAPRRELAQTGARADACVASPLVTVVSRGATRECAAYQIYGGSDEQPRDGATSQTRGWPQGSRQCAHSVMHI